MAKGSDPQNEIFDQQRLLDKEKPKARPPMLEEELQNDTDSEGDEPDIDFNDKDIFDRIRECFEVLYVSEDVYRGELQGAKRHGIGMFKYHRSGKQVIGRWKNDFLVLDGVKHPTIEDLVPLAVGKYEGRSKSEAK